jgi:hypothetical protein
MKKLIYTLSAAVLVAFSSCKNDSSVNPRPLDQIISKITISGLVRAELNNTVPSPSLGGSFANAEIIPATLNPKVIAEVSTEDLVLSTGEVTYVKKYFETTVSPTDGSYSVEVEVGPRGSQFVTLYYSDFRSDVILTATTVNKGKVFTGGSQGVTVSKGRNRIAPDYLIP